MSSPRYLSVQWQAKPFMTIEVMLLLLMSCYLTALCISLICFDNPIGECFAACPWCMLIWLQPRSKREPEPEGLHIL